MLDENGSCYHRKMKFLLPMNCGVTLEDVLKRFFNLSEKVKKQTEGQFEPFRTFNPCKQNIEKCPKQLCEKYYDDDNIDFCKRDKMIRCVNPAESAGNKSYYEYINFNVPNFYDEKKNYGDIFLTEFVEQYGYFHSPEEFLKEIGIGEPPYLSYVLPVYTIGETAEIEAEGKKNNFMISLETVSFGDSEKSTENMVKLLEIEDILSSEDRKRPFKNPSAYFYVAKYIIEDLLPMLSDASPETIFTIGLGRL